MHFPPGRNQHLYTLLLGQCNEELMLRFTALPWGEKGCIGSSPPDLSWAHLKKLHCLPKDAKGSEEA